MTCPIALIQRKPHLHLRTFRLQHRLAGAAEFQYQEDRGSRHDLGRNPHRSHSLKRRVDDTRSSVPGKGGRRTPRAVSSTEYVLPLNVKRRRLSPSR